MANVENIISEIVTGLVDNSRSNNVAIDEGWDADLAISVYYEDDELGNNAQLQSDNGIPTPSELAVIRERIAKFLAANSGWRWHDGEPANLIDP